MSQSAQERALQNYRRRLHRRGVARFEVLGLDTDRKLIRTLARRLAEDDPDAKRMRTTLNKTLSGEPARKGGILAALRRSPLVGANFTVDRKPAHSRRVDL